MPVAGRETGQQIRVEMFVAPLLEDFHNPLQGHGLLVGPFRTEGVEDVGDGNCSGRLC